MYYTLLQLHTLLYDFCIYIDYIHCYMIYIYIDYIHWYHTCSVTNMHTTRQYLNPVR